MSNDTELKRRMAALAAIALQETIDACRQVADETERVTGHRIASPERVSVTDASRADLERMLAQVVAGEHALRLALGWVVPGTTLGNMMKTMPEAAATELTAALVACGLLPADGA